MNPIVGFDPLVRWCWIKALGKPVQVNDKDQTCMTSNMSIPSCNETVSSWLHYDKSVKQKLQKEKSNTLYDSLFYLRKKNTLASTGKVSYMAQ